MNITELRELLTKELVTVTFTKKDGSNRIMRCTTMSEYAPEPSKTSVLSPTVVTVWDIEQDGWRSFRFDSIKSIETDYFNYVVES